LTPENRIRNDRWPLAAIIAAGLLLRLMAILAYHHAPESDEVAYQSMALNLIAGHGLIDNLGNRAMYNVGYPLFVLAPAFAISGGKLLAARLLNLILGGVSIFLCYAVAKEAGAGRTGRLLAAALWALYLPASIYAVYLAKENLMTPLMLGVMWCALRLLAAPAMRTAIPCGFLLGLLALVGNAALSLAGAVLIALLLGAGSLRQKLLSGLAILLLAGVVAAPWALRNQAVLGAPVLNTNGGFNLYLGNNPNATGWFMSIADTPHAKDWEALRKTGEVRASEVLKQDAIAWIRTDPGRFLALAARKAIYFWTPPFHQGQGPQSTTETAVRLLWAIQFVLIGLAALASLASRRLWNRQTLILWLAVAGYTSVHMLFYVIFRYREPIMPLMGILAALAVQAWLRHRASRASAVAAG
jgi:4-amino-4-deoxy-L-arabinose transferase-like glycosyltransferase